MLNCAINNETGGSANFLPVSHHKPIFRRYEIMDENTIAPIEKLCKCGCGRTVNDGKTYIRCHSSRVTKNFKLPSACKCGCGGMTKPGNVYIHGHNRQGTYHTEDEKKRIRESNIITYSDPEVLKRWQGENGAYFGKKHPPGVCAIMQAKAKERCSNPEFIKKIAETTKAALSDPKKREKISINALAMWQDPVSRGKLIASRKERWSDPELRKLKSKMESDRWKNDKDFIARVREARRISPNKQEVFIGELLNKMYPGEWKFTGDLSFIINGKCPDFTNCNGQKKLIEFFGDYWHKGDNAEDRAAVFAPFGYETLVIWEHELKDIDSVKDRIERFCGHEN